VFDGTGRVVFVLLLRGQNKADLERMTGFDLWGET